MAKVIGTFPYYGGKQRLCKSIAEFIPQGVASITDACGGSGKLIHKNFRTAFRAWEYVVVSFMIF